MCFAGIAFIIDGSKLTRPKFERTKKRILKVLPTLTISDKFSVPIVIYNGDKVISYKIKKPEDVARVSRMIRRLPFRPSSKSNVAAILKRVKKVTAGRKMKVIPVGRVSKRIRRKFGFVPPHQLLQLYKYSSKCS